MWMIQRCLTKRAFTEQTAPESGMEEEVISIAGEALLRMKVQAQVATAILLHLVVRYIYTLSFQNQLEMSGMVNLNILILDT